MYIVHVELDQIPTYLNVLGESSEHLLGHLEGFEEILPTLNVNGVIVGVVPVEVRDTLLKSKEIVHGTDDYVDGGRVTSLRSKVVLEVRVVSLTEKLKESKQALCKEVVGEHLAED